MIQDCYSNHKLAAGNPAPIEALLAEIWPETVQPLRVLGYCRAGSASGAGYAYAQQITGLLGGRLYDFRARAAADADLCQLAKEASRGYDLVIFEEPDRPRIKRLFSAPAGCKAVKRIPISVLVARRPRRLLNRILFVTREQDLDEVAIDWLARLAQPTNAAVTVLVVASPRAGPL